MNYILLAIVSASIGYWMGRISRSNEKPQLLPTPKCKVDGCGEPGVTAEGYCQDHWWYETDKN